jgi:predicted GTPase
MRLELQLAGLALTQGKALVIGLNKADAVPGTVPDTAVTDASLSATSPLPCTSRPSHAWSCS